MVTTLYTAILGLIYVALTFYVIKGRFKAKVSLGDGKDAILSKRIRAHGNFIEYVPLALILLFLAETEGVSETLLHILGAALVIGRISHPIGLIAKEGTSFARASGVILTLLVIFITAILCLKAYFLL